MLTVILFSVLLLICIYVALKYNYKEKGIIYIDEGSITKTGDMFSITGKRVDFKEHFPSTPLVFLTPGDGAGFESLTFNVTDITPQGFYINAVSKYPLLQNKGRRGKIQYLAILPG